MFADNEEVNKLLHEKGQDSLPITLIEGEVVKIGIYPSNDELANWFGVNVEELTKKPKIPLKIEL